MDQDSVIFRFGASNCEATICLGGRRTVVDMTTMEPDIRGRVASRIWRWWVHGRKGFPMLEDQ